jgi:hypothetical protein
MISAKVVKVEGFLRFEASETVKSLNNTLKVQLTNNPQISMTLNCGQV